MCCLHQAGTEEVTRPQYTVSMQREVFSSQVVSKQHVSFVMIREFGQKQSAVIAKKLLGKSPKWMKLSINVHVYTQLHFVHEGNVVW